MGVFLCFPAWSWTSELKHSVYFSLLSNSWNFVHVLPEPLPYNLMLKNGTGKTVLCGNLAIVFTIHLKMLDT